MVFQPSASARGQSNRPSRAAANDETLSHDTLPFVRTQALHIAFQLLSGNAEQEQNLLRLGVNKLVRLTSSLGVMLTGEGDSDRAVASKTSHHILQVLQVHPAMKAVIAREVSALILKPTGSAPATGTHIRFDETVTKPHKSVTTSHARYYGLITLNQMTLSSKDQDVAGRLVDLYFEVFRDILGDGKVDVDEVDDVEKVTGKVEKWRGRRKGAKPKGGRKGADADEVVDSGETKLIAAVLTGINRALPYAKLDEVA